MLNIYTLKYNFLFLICYFFSDLKNVIHQKYKMILTSTNLQSLAKNLDYADGKSILTTAGIHPTSCSEIDDENSEFRGDSYFTELRKIIDSNLDKIICIGECGLDYDPDREKFCPRQIQQKYQIIIEIKLTSLFKIPKFSFNLR